MAAFLMSSSRRQVTPAQKSEKNSTGGARSPMWTESDIACLQRTIDPLKNSFRFQPVGFLSAEATTMLCAPSSEVYERLTSMLTNISVVAGLVLSSISGVALSPLAVESFPPEKQVLAEAYNVMAALAVVIQLCVVLYSTFTLYIVVSAAHNPPAVYRALLHMKRWIGFFEYMTFIPPYLAIGLVCVAAHLYCKWLASRWIVTAASVALGVGFQAAFCHVMCRALPYNAWSPRRHHEPCRLACKCSSRRSSSPSPQVLEPRLVQRVQFNQQRAKRRPAQRRAPPGTGQGGRAGGP